MTRQGRKWLMKSLPVLPLQPRVPAALDTSQVAGLLAALLPGPVRRRAGRKSYRRVLPVLVAPRCQRPASSVQRPARSAGGGLLQEERQVEESALQTSCPSTPPASRRPHGRHPRCAAMVTPTAPCMVLFSIAADGSCSGQGTADEFVRSFGPG